MKQYGHCRQQLKVILTLLIRGTYSLLSFLAFLMIREESKEQLRWVGPRGPALRSPRKQKTAGLTQSTISGLGEEPEKAGCNW